MQRAAVQPAKIACSNTYHLENVNYAMTKAQQTCHETHKTDYTCTFKYIIKIGAILKKLMHLKRTFQLTEIKKWRRAAILRISGRLLNSNNHSSSSQLLALVLQKKQQSRNHRSMAMPTRISMTYPRKHMHMIREIMLSAKFVDCSR